MYNPTPTTTKSLIQTIVIPPNSCHKSRILLAAQVLSVLVAPCNTWLFLLRVRAIPRYPGSRLALYTCGILWLLTCSSPLIFRAFRASDVPIGDGTCVLISQFDGTFLSLPMITVAVFDSAIVVFVSLGLVMNTPTSSWVSIVRPALLVNGMGSVSRALLRSGQIYYLCVITMTLVRTLYLRTHVNTFCRATIGVHLSMVIITLDSTISAPYVSQLALLTSIFHTIMTCRVFRLLRLTYRLEVESRSDIDSSVLFMTPVQSDPYACTTAT